MQRNCDSGCDGERCKKKDIRSDHVGVIVEIKFHFRKKKWR